MHSAGSARRARGGRAHRSPQQGSRDVRTAAFPKRPARKTAVPLDHGLDGASGATATKQQRAAMLAKVMDDVNTKYGSNTVMKLDQQAMAVETIPTGALNLDLALGGGYPKGRVIEIFGPEASGKTTLALHAIAEVQKRGGTALFVDAEHAFDQKYAQALGIDTGELFVCQPDYGEQALNVVDTVVRSNSIDVVVVDSVSALIPRAELEGDIGQPTVGAQARLMSQALRSLTGNVSKSSTTLIFINQLRMKIGVLFGNPETTTGGQALKFYSSVRLDIRAKEKILEGGVPIGNKVRVKVVKNKVAPPFAEVEFDVMYGRGIDTEGCLLDAAEKQGVLRRRGAYYYYEDTKLGQGRDKALAYLAENPEMHDTIEQLTRAGMAANRAAAPPARAGGSPSSSVADASDAFLVDGLPGFGTQGEDDLDEVAELEGLVSQHNQTGAAIGDDYAS